MSKPDFPCPGCGKLLHTSTSSASPEKRLCWQCRRKPEHRQRMAEKAGRRDERRVMKNCAHCGVEFLAWSKKAMCCSSSCAQYRRCAEGRGRRTYTTPEEAEAAAQARWQRKNRTRRALERAAASEPYTLAEIAERDRCRCGLCGRKVRLDLRSPHPRSPTIDHIVPFSAGGDDLKLNVQLAHRVCNTRKGARGGGEQLALVG